MKLLSTNAKLSKTAGGAAAYLAAGLTLAPASLSGHNVCRASTAGCRSACLAHFSGQRVTPGARNKALRDTLRLFDNRAEFLADLNRDIASHVRKAEIGGLIPIIRLNVESDLDWLEVIERWPTVQFYDYTKIASRYRRYLAGDLPANYAITFSASERTTDAQLRDILAAGGNVATVFNVAYNGQRKIFGALPHAVELGGASFPVVDGDLHDIRLPEMDGRGVVVGLRLKGTNAAKDGARAHLFAK